MDKNNLPKIDFCAICGLDIRANTENPHLPVICPSCSLEGTMSLLTPDKNSKEGRRGILGGSYAGEFIKVVTYINDLGPANRPYHISKWPYKTFEVLSESKKSRFPATCWVFHNKMLPAIQKILEFSEQKLIIFDR